MIGRSPAAALLAVALSTQALADGPLISCTHAQGMAFYGVGGIAKRGWKREELEPDARVELWVVSGGPSWDIRITHSKGNFSAIQSKCQVSLLDTKLENALDMPVVTYCGDSFASYFFYFREGETRLIMARSYYAANSVSSAIYEATCSRPE